MGACCGAEATLAASGPASAASSPVMAATATALRMMTETAAAPSNGCSLRLGADSEGRFMSVLRQRLRPVV
ncbi:Uncharacterised protein [Bordetella pertussis]|nr:Uncharacterised protein [Bordetella pertussis]